jgi:hypothetical protein
MIGPLTTNRVVFRNFFRLNRWYPAGKMALKFENPCRIEPESCKIQVIKKKKKDKRL